MSDTEKQDQRQQAADQLTPAEKKEQEAAEKARDAIAQELCDFITAHPGKAPLSSDPAENLAMCRVLLDVSGSLASLTFIVSFAQKVDAAKSESADDKPLELTIGRDKPAEYGQAAGFIAGVLSPYCGADNLEEIVADCVGRYAEIHAPVEKVTPLEGDPIPGHAFDSLTEALNNVIEQIEHPGGDNLNRIIAHAVNNIEDPIDKIDDTIWNHITEEDAHGQQKFLIKTNRDSDPLINVYYSINFDVIESEAPIVKKLTQYDKRVYIATAALWSAGNSVVTVSQIYHAMGYTGKPSASTLEKIDKSLTKFGARITIDNINEKQAHYDYPHFTYDGDLLPFERIRERDVINGKLVESTIHLFREPPLITFAKGREQITTFPLKYLQSPISKTELNLSIEDYLLERIAKAKRKGQQDEKIKLATLYKNIRIDAKTDTARKQRLRAPEKIRDYLEYYSKCGLITGYSMQDDCIEIQL